MACMIYIFAIIVCNVSAFVADQFVYWGVQSISRGVLTWLIYPFYFFAGLLVSLVSVKLLKNMLIDDLKKYYKFIFTVIFYFSISLILHVITYVSGHASIHIIFLDMANFVGVFVGFYIIKQNIYK